MTVTYGFYDSLSNDRRYSAVQFSRLFDAIINDGVFMSIGQALVVGAGTGLNVTVGEGRAWFDHSWTYNDTLLTLAITTPHSVLDRIDTVVVETNSDSAVRANSIKVIDGTPATYPVPPTLQHTATLHQHPLGDVLVEHGSTQILAGNITNRVGTTDCPFVTGVLQTMNIDSLVAQWEAQFDLWFEFLQNELDANQAANLQAQILEHDHSDPLQTLIPTGGLMDSAITLLKLATSLRFQKIYEFNGDGATHPDFTSIPTDFTHLLLILHGTTNVGALGEFGLRINGDGTST